MNLNEAREALEFYRDKCHACGGTGVYRVKLPGQGRRSTPDNYSESPCSVCAPARRALQEKP